MVTLRPHLLLGVALAAVTLGTAMPAAAQPVATADESQPVLLNADTLVYDDELGIVTATGKVELAQGGRVLLADTVSFSEKTNVVVATGNVTILEPSGEALFADYAELTDDLRQGFIDSVRILLADDARIAGGQAERLDGRYTRIERAVYSPCELCREDPSRAPVWQLRAARVTHDQETRDVYYRDAVLEIAGIPVFYTPFFAHPDPTVERRSGFLAPGGGVSSDLGTFARVYYYWDIAPDKDFTLEVTPSTSDGLLLGAEYRQRFGRGYVTLSGSGTYTARTEGFGIEQTIDDEFRGHIFGTLRYDLSRRWRAGIDLQQVTDDSHLRRYDFTDDDLLTSRAFVERFEGRDYFVVSAYDFQDLRPGTTIETPLVAPLVTYSSLGEPGGFVGGRWSLDAGLLSILRNGSNDTHRLSAEAGWRREFVSPIGLLTTVQARLRGDGYLTNDLELENPLTGLPEPVEDDASFRFFPQGQVTFAYPLARQTGTVQQLIEPIVAYTVAPNLETDAEIPNEDSLDIEFDYTNLFRPSRYPGVDRLEGGQRVTYGVRAGLFGFGGGSSSLFIGQSYRFQQDSEYPAGTGLDDRLSDIVGRLELTPSPWLDVGYSFRFDTDEFGQRRHDVFGVAGPPIFRVSGSYLFLSSFSVDDSTVAVDREELTVAVNSAFTRNWSVGVSHRRDLTPDGGPINTGIVFTYQDDCFTFQLVGERDATQRTGIDSGNRVFFRIAFKNLGEFLSPTLSGNVFGSPGP